MSNELLPCPFCGSHDVEVQGKPAILDSLDSVLCNECTADAPYPVWNTRAKSTPAEHVQEPVAYGRWAEGLPKGTRLLRYDGMPQVDYKPSETFNVPLYAAPKAEQPPVQDITYWSIQVEKRLCEKLGKPWQASGMSIETLIDELAAAAPAQPQSDGVLMPVSDVEEYISLLIDEADAHLHGRHQPEIQAHMRAEIERVRALLGGKA